MSAAKLPRERVMKRRLVALCVAAVLAITGCGKDDLQGKVVDKRAQAGFMMMIPISTSCGQNCTTTMLMPFWIPPCYEITVQGATSGDTCISESSWNEIEIGDAYVGPDVDPEDRKEAR